MEPNERVVIGCARATTAARSRCMTVGFFPEDLGQGKTCKNELQLYKTTAFKMSNHLYYPRQYLSRVSESYVLA